MKIRNYNDLAEHFGTTADRLERALYKGTACGAWIDSTPTGVRIGSIVEGSDAEFMCQFKYPFDSSAVDNWLEELERLTDEAWHEANDDEEDD